LNILVLNPNTSKLVTQKIDDIVQRIARKDVNAVVTQIEAGPESLESYFDEVQAGPNIIKSISAAQDKFDSVLLAAFCDPCIEALKEISGIPVYGMEEVVFATALLLGNKFGILTEKKHKEAVKVLHVRKMGLESRFASVKALDMGVVEIAEHPERVKERAIAIAQDMVCDDGAEVIIMGCASMAGYSEELAREVGVPFLDPVITSYKMVEALTDAGLRISKKGLFAKPKEQKWNP
jgi:allantoin racemase